MLELLPTEKSEEFDSPPVEGSTLNELNCLVLLVMLELLPTEKSEEFDSPPVEGSYTQ